jgi:DNA-binding FadR family transcriptional regulator
MFQDANTGSIRVPKAAELVAARIRKAIVLGDLLTGDNIPSEAQLITDFKVSRPTIREAVRILESEGLISVTRGAKGGARVSQPDSNTVARAAGLALQTRGATVGDIYQARMIIEPPAARLAAERRPTDAAGVLRSHVERELELKDDVIGVTRAIAEFHRLLMEQSGNISLAITALALSEVFERHLLLAQRARPPVSEEARQKQLLFGLRSHARLVDFIEQGDGAAAETHWITHMRAAEKIWFKDLSPTATVDLLD